MTGTEFIDQIIQFYKESRPSLFPRKNIRRGRSHVISEITEDLFAVYVSDLVPDDVQILIDQPFTFRTNKSYTIYPDITLVRNNKIIKMYELKMDLGFNREFYPYCKSKLDLMETLRGKTLKCNDGTKSQNYIVNDDIKYNIIIVSNKNISKKKREENAVNIAALDQTKVEVFVLTEGLHPNIYDDTQRPKLVVKTDEFEKLNNEILSNL